MTCTKTACNIVSGERQSKTVGAPRLLLGRRRRIVLVLRVAGTRTPRRRLSSPPRRWRGTSSLDGLLVVGGVRVRLDGLLVVDYRLLLVIRVSCSTDRDYPCP